MKKTGKKKIIIVIVFLLLLAAGLWAGLSAGKNASAYGEAVELMQSGDADNAYRMFQELDGYKDSEDKMAELVRQDPALPYRVLSKGDVLTFGQYEQDNDTSDGTEPVEWIVLDRIDDEVLLLSACCLDCRPYNGVPFEPVTWETSELREWLNGEFYDAAFSGEEKKLIMEMDNENPDHSVLETEGGADTKDRVYIFSEVEAGIYMADEMDQEYVGKAYATDHAIAHGAETDDEGMTEWWLRTPGAYEYTAQFVETTGIPYNAGAYVELSYGVRPAVWLDVGSK